MPGAGARAFQRVKAEEWLGHKAARDNSYQATFGSGGWGAGAQEVLGRVRTASWSQGLRSASGLLSLLMQVAPLAGQTQRSRARLDAFLFCL